MHPAAEVIGLKKSYLVGSKFWTRRAQFEALSGVDLDIWRGEILGVVGRNGYGKTTLIRCVAGLLAPSNGQVKIWGKDTVRDGHEIRGLIGWVGAEERSFYLRLTARQNLMFFSRLQGLPDADAAERIGHLSERLHCESMLDRRVHELSTGNRQRISIIRGMLHAPKLLILDEPTRSLDPFAAKDLRTTLVEWVKQDGQRAILITSHDLHEVESVSDRIAIMGKGRIGAIGPIQELRSQWPAGERVRVRVGTKPSAAACAQLSAEGVEVTVEESDGHSHVVFRPRDADPTLDRVLGVLIHEGVTVLGVATEEVQLQDLIDHWEGKSS